MTIYKVIPQDKKEEKKKAEKDALAVPLTEVEPSEPIQVNVVRQQRSKTWLNLFLILIALLVLATGVTAGYYLYKNHMSPKGKNSKGWCSFVVKKMEEPTTQMFKGEDMGLPKIDDGGLEVPEDILPNKRHRKHHKHHGPFTTVKMEEEIEVIDEKYERIRMPRIDDILDSLILHDFELNKSAIVDYHDKVCYVMNLNRKEVSPPRNLIDLINKINTGYYLPRASVLRKKYQVRLPALRNIARLGPYILHECSAYRTYQLERIAGDDEFARNWIVKRSVGAMDDMKKYGYFENQENRLIEMDLYFTETEKF